MASRASKSRWFLRDLPRSYIVIAAAVVAAVFVTFIIGWSSPPPPAAAVVAQPTQAEIEKRYRGSIIFPTNKDGICLTVLLDNRTGHLTEGGYGKCEPDEPRKVAKEPDEQARIRALGAAFRR